MSDHSIATRRYAFLTPGSFAAWARRSHSSALALCSWALDGISSGARLLFPIALIRREPIGSALAMDCRCPLARPLFTACALWLAPQRKRLPIQNNSWPCETRTSTWRSFATISSGLYRFLAIAVLLDVKRHTSSRTTSMGADHWPSGSDPGGRWPARLVARAAEDLPGRVNRVGRPSGGVENAR
jgi:hypothetical protein